MLVDAERKHTEPRDNTALKAKENAMLISKRIAIRTLRQRTGLSLATCAEKVNGLPKYRDGLRDKILAKDLEAAAREALMPVTTASISPLSERMKAKIRGDWPDTLTEKI